MTHFYTFFLNFKAVNRDFLFQFFLGFILFFTSFFSKANTQQPPIASNNQSGVIYVVGETLISGDINAEIVIINEKPKVKIESPKNIETVSKILLAAKKEQISAKIKEEIANVKPAINYKFSLPFSQKIQFGSPSKYQLFVVHETQLSKILGLKSIVIFDKIIIQSPLKILSSYFQFSIISKQNYAFHFTRPPPGELVI